MDIFYHLGLFELLSLLNENFGKIEQKAFKVAIALVYDWYSKFPKLVAEQRIFEQRPLFGAVLEEKNN